MTFFRSVLLFGAASALLGQTPPPKPSAPPPSSAPQPTPSVKFEVENPNVKPPVVPPDRVVLTVGNIKVTAAQFDQLVDTLQPQYRALARGAQRKQFADNIVKMITLAQEAERLKLNESADFKTQSMFQNFNLLASLMANQIGKDVQVSEEDLRKYYSDHKAEFETVHARHILIRVQGAQMPLKPGQKDLTDAEALAKAQEIRKKLQDGTDFATLAKAESDDAGSGANGGDLPPFRHGQMVPTFEVAAFAMKPGEISEPVKSQFGYHVIQVISHDTKPFEEVRPDLETRVKPEQSQKAINTTIDNLEKANPAVLDPEFFPAPKPAEKPADKPAVPLPIPPPDKR